MDEQEPKGEPTEAPPPPPEEPPGLPTAKEALHDAHGAVSAASAHVKNKYPDDDKLLRMLDFIHDAVAGAGDHVDYHMDAAKDSKEWGQIVLGQAVTTTMGIALGHFLTLPREPKTPISGRAAAFFAGLKPETRSTLMGMIEQGAALASAWVQGQRAGAVPREDAPPATPADGAPPEPVVTPPPAS